MKLSVALCTYNGDKYLKEQLDSILNQELPVDEIVICDDGSTDNTLTIIKEISVSFSYVRWIVERNIHRLGVTKNFEKAISLCSGNFILLSDQDDIWAPNKTQLIIRYFKNHPQINLVFSDACFIDKSGNIIGESSLFDVTGLNSLMEMWENGLTFEIENVEQRLLGATFGMRSIFAKSCLPFNESIKNYHDGQLAMNAVVSNSIGVLPQKLISYRLHDTNTVGLGGNRILKKSSYAKEFAFLVEPRMVSPLFRYSDNLNFNKRISFYKKRFQLYKFIIGKIILGLSVYSYIKYYKKYWWAFYSNDLLYGVQSKLRKLMHYEN